MSSGQGAEVGCRLWKQEAKGIMRVLQTDLRAQSRCNFVEQVWLHVM